MKATIYILKLTEVLQYFTEPSNVVGELFQREQEGGGVGVVGDVARN